jgi:hypothetical protein
LAEAAHVGVFATSWESSIFSGGVTMSNLGLWRWRLTLASDLVRVEAGVCKTEAITDSERQKKEKKDTTTKLGGVKEQIIRELNRLRY